MRHRAALRVEGRRCILRIGREAGQGSQTGEQSAEDNSCDAGCRWVRDRLWIGRFCGTGQWRGYCRSSTLGRPRHSSPWLMRTRPPPTFWTLCARMRTRLVPALSAGTLPAKVTVCRISSPWLPPSHIPKESTPMTISIPEGPRSPGRRIHPSRRPSHQRRMPTSVPTPSGTSTRLT
jgi:hypothetical protein